MNEKYGDEYSQESGMIKSSRNPFISSPLDSEVNNFFFHADKRFGLNYNSESLQSPTSEINNLFDGHYDQYKLIVNPNETLTLNMDLTAKGELGNTGLIYGNGYITVSTYHVGEIANFSVTVKRNHPTAGVSTTHYENYEEFNQYGKHLYRMYISGNYITGIETNIIGSSNTSSSITEVEYLLSRPVGYQLSGVSKYRDENFYKKISLKDGNNDTQILLDPSGAVGIGTANTSGFQLAVTGNEGIIAEKVSVKLKSQWPDFVFEESYNLPPLEYVEKYINNIGHLENIPSAEDVKKNGIELGEMNTKLLEKIEQLTLYLIEQNKKNKELENRIKDLEGKINKL